MRMLLLLILLLLLLTTLKCEQPLLNWSNITITYDDKSILSLGYGSVINGRVLGLLGPSGSGKSTFLNVISKRIKHTSKLKTKSNDVKPKLKDNEVSFVYQQDSFFSMITVEETLLLAANLKKLSQSHISDKNISTALLVKDVMNSLQLEKVSEAQVGDPSVIRGISGGERRRLAVAQEILGNPKLLIVDEATSGLDSRQAYHVMEILRDIAKSKNIAVVVAIHQPRSSIWTLFDDILLLTPRGEVAYMGPRRDILDHFEKLGYRCPDHTNPAEFLIDLVSIDVQNLHTRELSLKKINDLALSFEKINNKHHFDNPMESIIENYSKKHRGFHGIVSNTVGKVKRSVLRFSLLFLRSAKQAFRDKATNVVRLLVSGVLAAVIGQLYGRQDDNLYQSSVADRVNIIAQAAINVGMLSMIKALQLFKREKPIIDRERLSNQYSSLEYLLAKLSSEMPMDAAVAAAFGFVLHLKSNLRQDRNKFVSVLALLGTVSSSLGLAIGAMCPTGDVALAVGPALMVVYVIMGSIGPAGSSKNLPFILKPLRYFSPFRWACEGLCAAEFKNQEFIPVKKRGINPIPALLSILPKKSSITGGDRTMEALGIKDATYSNAVKTMTIMFACHCFASFIGLIFRAP